MRKSVKSRGSSELGEKRKSKPRDSRRSAESVFYYEIDDIVSGPQNSRPLSEHVYQNSDDAESKKRQITPGEAAGDMPKPPPRLKKKAKSERGGQIQIPGISTEDEEEDDIEGHEYVYPDDPSLDAVRPVPQIPPALPARSRSCVADLHRAQERTLVPLSDGIRHDSCSGGGAESRGGEGPAPPLPLKMIKTLSINELPDHKKNNIQSTSSAQNSGSSTGIKGSSRTGIEHCSLSTDEEDEDGYIYPGGPRTPLCDGLPAESGTSTLKYKDSGISISGPPMLIRRPQLKSGGSESSTITIAEEKETKAEKSVTIERSRSWSTEIQQYYAMLMT